MLTCPQPALCQLKDMDQPVGSCFSLCLRGLAKSITERPQDGSALS